MPPKKKGYGDTERKFAGVLHGETPLPSDENSERAVIGSIITDPDAASVAIEIFGDEPVFFSPKNQKIFDVSRELLKKEIPIDPVNLSKALKDEGVFDEVGGVEYLVQLQNSIATTANIESWCHNVREKAIQRKIIRSLSVALERSYDPQEQPANIIGKIDEELVKAQLLGTKDPVRKIDEVIKNEAFPYIEKILRKEKPEALIETLYPDLDKRLGGGMKPGEMYVIAARPGVGKTSFALNVLTNVALSPERTPVAMFSMEMTAAEIARRLLYTEAKISRNDILDPSLSDSNRNSMQSRITGAASRFKNAAFFIDPTPALKIMDLRVRVKNLIRKHGIKLIAVDYLQLMHSDEQSNSDTRQIEVSLISGGIKAIAKDLNIPVIVLAQLNRQTEQQKEGKPKLSNLRESGAIEQDADVVMFLHRDTQKQQDATRQEEDEGLFSELIIAKNRNGEMGKSELLFFPKITLFVQKGRFSKEDLPARK
ncbi:MAG TPA: replicative DNA helicase [Victivallales bacterium]|nr:replicative DNA helicase [Victivallales bacterium]